MKICHSFNCTVFLINVHTGCMCIKTVCAYTWELFALRFLWTLFILVILPQNSRPRQCPLSHSISDLTNSPHSCQTCQKDLIVWPPDPIKQFITPMLVLIQRLFMRHYQARTCICPNEIEHFKTCRTVGGGQFLRNWLISHIQSYLMILYFQFCNYNCCPPPPQNQERSNTKRRMAC